MGAAAKVGSGRAKVAARLSRRSLKGAFFAALPRGRCSPLKGRAPAPPPSVFAPKGASPLVSALRSQSSPKGVVCSLSAP